MTRQLPRTRSSRLFYLCLHLLVLPVLAAAQSVVTASTVTVAGPTATTFVAAASTPASSQYTDDLTFRTSMLSSTNLYRFQHNASYLAWNDSLASFAADYASKCIWSHSHSSEGYGENLARGYPDVTSAVDAWGNERDQYKFSGSGTGFSEATGHFTQLVWKFTQTVGCGAYACGGQNGVDGYMLVCEYWPAGNVEGTGSNENIYFDSQVQSQVRQGDGSGSTTFNTFSATAGATGIGNAQATGSLVASATGNSHTSDGNHLSLATMQVLKLIVALWLWLAFV